MIILDTNVVSEFMRSEPHPGVIAWADSIPRGELWITTITVAELAAGVALLPTGARKLQLGEDLQQMLNAFDGRVLAFTTGAAPHYGGVVAARTRIGRPVSVPDAEIAAIAIEAGAAVATRNTLDFEGVGIDLIDPWSVG